MTGFGELQAGLAGVWACTEPGTSREHVVVSLPSINVTGSLREHYARRLPALEQRYLVDVLHLHRDPSAHLVWLCSEAPAPVVVDYYADLLPGPDVRDRLDVVVVPGDRSRSLTANLLDRADLLARIRKACHGLPALLEPWIVTDEEVRLGLALGIPVDGCDPSLLPLGHKSPARRLFSRLAVPTAAGRCDVRSAQQVASAALALRDRDPSLRAVVVKLDDSASGDGNAVLDLGGRDAPVPAVKVRDQVAALPEWYLEELRYGAVVEALVEGPTVSSPSVQLDLTPTGEVRVLGTHEQVLGGRRNQVYLGCRFPANPGYAAELARHGRAVGAALAAQGAVGRAGVDFIARADDDGEWHLHALEINLRKGATTPPLRVLGALVPGRYDEADGRWEVAGGGSRSYWSTDNLVDAAWVGTPPERAITAVADAGLRFDPATGTGVVLHMLAGLGIDGRFGLTAIGLTPDHAASVYERAVAELRRCLDRTGEVTASPAAS